MTNIERKGLSSNETAPATVTPGSSLKIYISFSPVSDGYQIGEITFNSNAPTSPDAVSVSGLGVSPVYSANTDNLNFGNVVVGKSKLDSVSVTNEGTGNLVISSISSSNNLYVVGQTSGTITPGNTIVFYVTFSPIADGVQNGTLTINHNGLNSQNLISLTGTGVSPRFAVNPTSLDFGSVILGESNTKSVIVSNSGTSDLNINSIESTNGLFTFSPIIAIIGAGSSQEFMITFTPLVDGYQSGNITFNHDATSSPNFVAVSGTGVSPKFTVSSISIDFGNVELGTHSTHTIVVSNNGTSNLNISSIESTNGLFTYSPSFGTITPGSSQEFMITFTPLVDGYQVGQITCNHDATTSPDFVTVSGTGVSPKFTVNQQNIDFGNVLNGTQKNMTVIVTNTGTSDLYVSEVTSTNVLFTISPIIQILSPGDSQSFVITFSPLEDGLQTGTVTFKHNASSIQDIISVSGTGVSPIFSVNPENLNFGYVRVGESKTLSVVVKNIGTYDLSVSNILSNNSEYTVNPKSGVIAPGMTMTVYITYSPSKAIDHDGIIEFYHDAVTKKGYVYVTGRGVSPFFTVDRLYIDFGNVLVGTSKMDSVVVTNTGQVDLIISSTTSTYKLFAVTPFSGTLAPGQSMKFYIEFTPVENGHRHGYVYFNNNGLVNDFPINVKGVGISP